jgi:hypothetical protein
MDAEPGGSTKLNEFSMTIGKARIIRLMNNFYRTQLIKQL